LINTTIFYLGKGSHGFTYYTSRVQEHLISWKYDFKVWGVWSGKPKNNPFRRF